MTDTSDTVGKQITFCSLFEEFGYVEIPIIQRDYAQGRHDQKELRDEFLKALKDALYKNDDDSSLPLNLDFIYGSGSRNDGATDKTKTFAPLDGQQRLTTLFLLHWYLAWKDGQTEDFQSRFFRKPKSLLGYEVRLSSHDFFNSLAEFFPDEKPGNVPAISNLIQDKHWFFLPWKNDPTIASALEMLGSIHEHFAECDDYYERIISNEYPRITFHLLKLENFGLSDDLYIKMNARGKPLTAFENFKAQLEQHLDELLLNDMRELYGETVPVKEYFSHQMDTKWADLFWKHRNQQTNLFDDKVMNLVTAVSLVCLDTAEEKKATDTVGNLRESQMVDISFARYDELGCLNPKMLKTLIALMDYWTNDGVDRESEETTFVYGPAKALDTATEWQPTYSELVKFGAFSHFIHIKGGEDQQALAQWLRVIHNLVENTDVERHGALINALRSVEELMPSADKILEYLVSGKDVKFFNRQQVQEERVKASLILRAGDWPKAIYGAERHGYFQGQIEFLLKFSGILDHWKENEVIEWSADEEADAFDKFSEYWRKADAVFGPSGLRNFDDYKWERALLCKGDYTLKFRRNKSFLKNIAGGRRPTWKRLLQSPTSTTEVEKQRGLVKEILDSIDLGKGVEASLDNVINNSTIDEAWRKMIVKLPDAIEFCMEGMFRKRESEKSEVYLISKLQKNSAHAELWSYHLYHTLLQQMQEAGDLKPFEKGYKSVSGESDTPHISLKWGKDVTIKIRFHESKFRAKVDESEASARGMIARYIEQFCNDGEVPDGKIEDFVKGLVAKARSFATETN